MPFQTQFSLSLELAKIFPVREALSTGAEHLVSLVRALKKEGSDFLVEEDLAVIFGRGKIEPQLEEDFRKVVRIGSVQPLYPDSLISLDAGPATTIRRALKDRFYMSCVIQLSFLTWMHEITSLSAALTEGMLNRHESAVQGSTPNPDYDGILKTLQACSAQTSQYHWENLVLHVEQRFQKSIQHFRTSGGLLRSISSNVLEGAIDYLYMAQSLPEDRFIRIESQAGLLPIVIWAHYILGLNVLVMNSPDGDVAFGRLEAPQLIIRWSSELESLKGPNIQGPSPTIYLLDANMQVILQVDPNDNKHVAQIEGQECCRLKGYGTLFLQRFFNTSTFVADNDPVIVESANFAVTFAIYMSLRMVPQAFGHFYLKSYSSDILKWRDFTIENWRIFDSSDILLWGIQLDKGQIVTNVNKLHNTHIYDMTLPTSVRNHDISGRLYVDNIKQLASWILSFAHVVDVKSCAAMPVRISPGCTTLPRITIWGGLDLIYFPWDT